MLWAISLATGSLVYPLRNANWHNIWWTGDGGGCISFFIIDFVILLNLKTFNYINKDLKLVSGCGAWQCWHWHPWTF